MDGVTGLGELEALARRFREAGSGSGLADDVGDELEDAAHRIDDPVRRSVSSKLPSSGGLAGVVADGLDFEVNRRGDGGVEVQVSSSVDLQALDSGVVHHPVFGRAPNVTQRVPEGTVSDPLKASEDDFGRAAEKGVARTARYVEKGIL